MKQQNNCVIIYDVTTNDYKIIAFKSKRALIRTLLRKIEKDHEIRVNPALFTMQDDENIAS